MQNNKSVARNTEGLLAEKQEILRENERQTGRLER
jgi:hypothetical protein